MGYKEAVETIFEELRDYKGEGKVADYIPALACVNPESYSISVATLDGEVISIGDAGIKFSLQSISKVFTLAMVCKLNSEQIWKSVGREPSGSAFNSLIQLESESGIPRNPFINAGALVVTDRLIDLYEKPKHAILEFVRENCGSEDIYFDQSVAKSEYDNSYRNLALAHFMKDFGNIHNDVESVIDVYCNQCSIAMNTTQLARSFLFLANGGVQPSSGKEICGPRSAKRMNALMLTCGLYNESGDFAYRVGLPGKSGVGGGIVAVIPGRLAISVWSPELNSNGNSYRGIETLARFTTKIGISVF